ncbi:hypothetical protein JL720_9757 [Aureococcus anophagefferens]|nr:hypothetical protein JL720_9757 [Aureococcus anophagefferens]
MKRLGVTALAGIARGSWVGPSDCVRDANGCCASAGFFYCGSSGRCTHDWDQCEDGLGDAPSSCALDYEVGGLSASFDLSALRIRTGSVDYEANGGSASRDDTFAASPLDAARPTRGVALDYAGGDVCGRRRAGGVRSTSSATRRRRARPRGLRDDARGVRVLRGPAVRPAPAGLRAAASGAVCGGHGDRGTPPGARAATATAASGPACDGGAAPAARRTRPAPGPRASGSGRRPSSSRRRGRRRDRRRPLHARRARSAVRCGSDTRYRTVDVTDDDDAGVEMDNRARRSPSTLARRRREVKAA